MPLPTPHPGLVIGYAYLWLDQQRSGLSEGSKDRPCAIVLTVESDDGQMIVTVAPITHSAPRDPDSAVELPAATKQRLGLDGERSWVVVSEVNRFAWSGPDLRPVSRDQPGRFDYGTLPPTLFRQIAAKLADLARRRRTAIVVRSD